MPPLISTIIPTIGRAQLQRAVTSVLDQAIDPDLLELIVVNDSGRPLTPEPWQQSSRVTVMRTPRRERSAARNHGAAVAQGRFLHFLDDDDYLLPGGLGQLLQAALRQEAACTYGITALYDRQGNYLYDLEHRLQGNLLVQLLAGEWIPLAASLISADIFRRCGGFDETLAGPEDICLMRRLALAGEFRFVPARVLVAHMGEAGGSTEWRSHAQQSRRSRERLLNDPRTFGRLQDSIRRAENRQSYWHGRAVRAFWTSAVWNTGQARLLTALKRTTRGMSCLAAASTAVFSPDFRQALLHPHQSFFFQDRAG